MSKLKLKSRLSSDIESKAIALAMLVLHAKGNNLDTESLAKRILKAYAIRGKIK